MALFDAFLKLDGIDGESADSKHKGEIDVMSFSWGAAQTGVQATGGGGGAGKVHFMDFHITKKVDKSSPKLMLACADGEHLKSASFLVRKAGGEQLEYLKIKLTDVLVSSYKSAGSEAVLIGLLLPAIQGAHKGGDEIPMEQVSLNFAKIEFSYQPQGADGKPQGGPIMAGWDVKGNVKA